MASSQRRFPSIRRHTASKAATYGTSHIKLEPCDAPCTATPTRGGKSRVRPSDPCVDGDKILMPWNTVGRDLILSDVYTGEFAVIDDGSGDENEWDISEDDNIFAMIIDNDDIDDTYDVETSGSISEYEWDLAKSVLEYEEQDALDEDAFLRRYSRTYDEPITEATFQLLLESDSDAYDYVYGETAHLEWNDDLFDEDFEMMLGGEYDWMYHETTDEELLEEIQVELEQWRAMSAYDRSVRDYNSLDRSSRRRTRAIRPLTEAAHALGIDRAVFLDANQKGWWMKSKPGISWKRNRVNQFGGNDRREAIEVKNRWLNSPVEFDDAGLTEFIEMQMRLEAEFMADDVDLDVDPLWHAREVDLYFQCERMEAELNAELGPVYLVGDKLIRKVEDDFGDDYEDLGYDESWYEDAEAADRMAAGQG